MRGLTTRGLPARMGEVHSRCIVAMRQQRERPSTSNATTSTKEGLKAAGYRFTSDPADMPWLWREAELFDPGGNRILLYWAGKNRLDPPWRIRATR
jgi:hypothetical protein